MNHATRFKSTLFFRFIFFFCISLWAGAEMSAVFELGQWTTKTADRRSALNDGFAQTPLSKAEAAQAADLLALDKIGHLQTTRLDEWQAETIRMDGYVMRLKTRTFGTVPDGGRSLYISLHGGGGTAPSVNDSQWANQIKLYKTPEGSLYIAPRAPTNDWDLWHKPHIDGFFQRLIEDAIVFEKVNPNRVYVMGYSAGGDGVYQLAPRMADRWAAAAMMAGHPNDASPLGLRNIGFSLWCGELDGAYDRNKIAGEWEQKLADLHKSDPDGYRHEVHIQKGMGHWMNGTDKAAVEWMDGFTRDPFPKKIVWMQDDVTHERFYWLGMPEGTAKKGALVVVERSGQTITIQKAETIKTLIIYLNDDMCDLDKPIKVMYEDKTLFEGKVNRTIQTIAQCLDQRVDPASIFYAQIQVDLTR